MPSNLTVLDIVEIRFKVKDDKLEWKGLQSVTGKTNDHKVYAAKATALMPLSCTVGKCFAFTQISIDYRHTPKFLIPTLTCCWRFQPFSPFENVVV